MSEEPKTTRATWQPARKLQVVDQETDGRKYRWCDKDPANLDRKEYEGWQFANATTGNRASPNGTLDENRVSGAKTQNELVLMTLDKERVEARTRYFQDLTDKQTAGLAENVKSQAAAKGGSVHGKITIE